MGLVVRFWVARKLILEAGEGANSHFMKSDKTFAKLSPTVVSKANDWLLNLGSSAESENGRRGQGVLKCQQLLATADKILQEKNELKTE